MLFGRFEGGLSHMASAGTSVMTGLSCGTACLPSGRPGPTPILMSGLQG